MHLDGAGSLIINDGCKMLTKRLPTSLFVEYFSKKRQEKLLFRISLSNFAETIYNFQGNNEHGRSRSEKGRLPLIGKSQYDGRP
jgi:hypothetical protein